MWSKFNAGLFGAPNRVKGISRPMNASISMLGRVTQYSPRFPDGTRMPAESYANQKPKPPVYRNIPRVPGGGYDSSGINPRGNMYNFSNPPITWNV